VKRWLLSLLARPEAPEEVGELQERFLVAGLGNPGPRYVLTRHNVGFLVVDRLAEAAGLSWRQKGRAFVASWRGGWLMKPATYMNDSGEAVAPFVRYYKIPLERLLVVHDDMDLPLGRMRLRRGGGSGGQKGVQSIINSLGGADFDRLRVGVGRPPQGWSAVDWVLSRFDESERPLLEKVLEQAAAAVALWQSQGLLRAQQKYNGLDLGEAAKGEDQGG